MRRAIDWAFTVPFLVAFGAILLVFDPLQRIARAFGRRPHEIVVGLMQVSLTWSLRICGTRIHVEGAAAAGLPPPCLFVTNHQSMFDIPLLGAIFFRHYPKYVSKRELAARWIPSVSYNLRRGGNALIDRGDREGALAEIRKLGREEVRGRGVSAAIFPEGTRARAGVLGAFRPQGAVALMQEAPAAPVVPVAIDGSWRVVRHGMTPVPFGTRIRIFVGAPIARASGDDPHAVVAAAREVIENALDRWRGHPGA